MEIPEAITQGKDMDELMFMMQDAIELALECRRDEFRQQYADENAFVPRHPNIDEYLAYDICKQLDIPKPKFN